MKNFKYLDISIVIVGILIFFSFKGSNISWTDGLGIAFAGMLIGSALTHMGERSSRKTRKK